MYFEEAVALIACCFSSKEAEGGLWGGGGGGRVASRADGVRDLVPRGDWGGGGGEMSFGVGEMSLVCMLVPKKISKSPLYSELIRKIY
jgi:hypothetical protein